MESPVTRTVGSVRRAAHERVATIAARQHGVLSRSQAIDAGLTRHMVATRVRSGLWKRVHPGVFTVVGSPATWHQKVMSAVLAAGPGAVASHLTAAALYGMHGVERGRIEITIPRTSRLALHRVVVHRSLVLADEDRTMVDGIPTTSAARTLADCSGALSLGQLARGMDGGFVERWVRHAQVNDVATRLGPAPGRRITNVRKLIAERGVEVNLSGSRPEMRVIRVLREAGMREPVPQFPVRPAHKQYFIDAAYPDALLALEYQGFDPHRTRTAFDGDARRTRELTAVGWRVVYFTSKDSDADIVATVRAFGV